MRTEAIAAATCCATSAQAPNPWSAADDADDATDGGRDERPCGEASERERPSEQRDLDRRERRQRERQRQHLDDRAELRLVDERADQRTDRDADDGQQRSRGERGPERRVDLALRHRASLDQRVPQSLVDEELREGDEHGRQRDKAEVRIRKQPGEEDEGHQVDHLATPDVGHRPRQAPCDTALEVGVVDLELGVAGGFRHRVVRRAGSCERWLDGRGVFDPAGQVASEEVAEPGHFGRHLDLEAAAEGRVDRVAARPRCC